MHAVGACRQRHVEPVVDEDAGPRAADGFDAARHQPQERPAVEVALANGAGR
jgi:hypothetical protein